MDLFDRGLIGLMLQLVSAQVGVTLGRIEYLEPLLSWFYLFISISFHRCLLFLLPSKFWLVAAVPKCFVSRAWSLP
jgi:hypothetical protein